MDFVKLTDVCRPKQWKTISGKDLLTEGYPVYGANGIIGYWSDYNHVSETLTIACRGTCGTVNIVPAKSYINGNAMSLDGLSDTMNLRFLYYYLKGYDFKEIITGTTIPQITIEGLRKVLIPCLSLEKQEELVQIFDKVQNVIDARQKEIQIFDDLIKARFVEMFGDPDTNPKGWAVDTLGHYMTVLTDFSANGSYELLDSNVIMRDEPDYAIMVRTTDLESGNLVTGVKYIDQHSYELLSKSKLFGGELIMNKIGSAGKIYVMPKIDRPASLGRNAFMFRFDDRINMPFLYALLTTEYGEREIQQYVRGAVTKTITKDATRSIRIIVPPIELQEQFAAFVAQIDKSKSVIQKSLDETQLLFDSLMQKYLG